MIAARGYDGSMIKKGRILLDGTPCTEMIQFKIDVEGGSWRGSFSMANWDKLGALPGGIGQLELADGTVTAIYLLKYDAGTETVTFHCPSAPV